MQKQQYLLATLSLVILVTFTNLVAAQKVRPGPCPKVTTVKDFNVEKYSGAWNVFKRYPGNFVPGGHCLVSTYTYLGNNKLRMSYTRLDENNTAVTNEGTAEVIGSGKLLLHVDYGSFGGTFHDYVIDTDYVNYLSVYTCDEGPANSHTESLGLLVRDIHTSDVFIKKGLDAMAAQHLAVNDLVFEDRKNCTRK